MRIGRRNRGDTIIVKAVWLEIEGRRLRMPLGRAITIENGDTLDMFIRHEEVLAMMNGNQVEVEWNDE